MGVQTRTIVNPSADVVRITHLSKHDVYKRLDSPSYGSPSLKFGVVTDVLTNGTGTVITALEWDVEYNAVKAVMKTFATETELELFEADPAETEQYLLDVRSGLDKVLETKSNEVDALKATRRTLNSVLEQSRAGMLSAPATTSKPLLEAVAEPED